MRNTLLIMRQEIYKILHSPAYVIFAFLFPVVAVLILAGVKIIQARQAEGDQRTENPADEFAIAKEGYVDLGGLIGQLPENIPSDHLMPFADEAAAQKALASGAISAYYLIPADFLQDGRVEYVYPDRRSYLDDGQPWVIEWTLLFNLVEGDANLADRVWNPIHEVTATPIASQSDSSVSEDCSKPGAACKSNDLVRFIPSIMTVLFFTVFMSSSSMLFNSIAAEKENRMLEVLMLSVSPRQLLAGKTMGMGAMGLLQTVLWLVALYIAFNLGGATLSLPNNFTFPPEILLWSLIFFLGGFCLYASLMAGAGALVTKMKEAGAANYIVMFPLFIAYAFGLMAPLANNADSPLILFLSFFPLTSPVVMVMRLTNGTAPLWQLLISVLLLLVTAYYLLSTAAAMFHAHNLLSGQPFSLRRYFAALARK